ncbi:hypothetical protein JAAARDRAFT_433694 [Jaapia argillacea MUCL 33604]|uniref:Uncharacterized protein n=1 Tax=Jaapia argillacea MUCL 33604 TaxID=933084 RepID=A0A067PEY8_9AGAM|nr:hypothetical protein JAAARDRAFT_433694 [Jaapia argillacea MUCL 33604]
MKTTLRVKYRFWCKNCPSSESGQTLFGGLRWERILPDVRWQVPAHSRLPHHPVLDYRNISPPFDGVADIRTTSRRSPSLSRSHIHPSPPPPLGRLVLKLRVKALPMCHPDSRIDHPVPARVD